LFQRGSDKLARELNVVNIIKAQRQSNFLTYNLLEKKQRTLLAYQKKHVLETESSDESDPADWFNLKNQLDHQSPFVRLLALGKAKKLINKFEWQPLSKLD